MSETFSLRKEYGKLLVEYGERYKNIVVLDADLAKSTQTESFKKVFPDRFFDMGISEADMMATAAGLASAGKIPFCSTFAIFASGRAWDQVRNSIAYPHWPVKIVVTHGGISLGEDGASHQANEDIALMRVIPGMTVIVPSDVNQLKSIFRQIVEYDSYLYMRLPRNNLEMIYDENETFKIGQAKQLRKGSDITIITCGAMVNKAMNTVKRFASLGIECGIVDMFTVKPIDIQMIKSNADETKGILICEEHQKIGGLGEAVCSALSEIKPLPVEHIGLEDTFGESGNPDELFKKYKLDEESIIEKGKKLYDRIQ